MKIIFSIFFKSTKSISYLADKLPYFEKILFYFSFLDLVLEGICNNDIMPPSI